jgi:hypothetical protein
MICDDDHMLQFCTVLDCFLCVYRLFLFMVAGAGFKIF